MGVPRYVKIILLLFVLVLVGHLIWVLEDRPSLKDLVYSKLPFGKAEPSYVYETVTSFATKTETAIKTTVQTVNHVTTKTVDATFDAQFTGLSRAQLEAIREIKADATHNLISVTKDDKSETNLLARLSEYMDKKYGTKFDDSHPLKGVPLKLVKEKIVADFIKSNVLNIDELLVDHLEDRQTFYKWIVTDLLLPFKPDINAFEGDETGYALDGKGKYEKVESPKFSKNFLDIVKPSKEKIDNLKKHHKNLIAKLKRVQLPPKLLFRGSGIVIPSSGVILPGALVAIGQIRELGSKLPIEVILNNEGEYNKHICEDLLPLLNAECVVLEREIGKKLLDSLNLKKFQLKAITLLVSKFDHTLWLDADNAPLKNVDDYFDSDVYRDTKFVLWPDLMKSSISPIYYDIADIEIGERIHREGLKNGESLEEYSKLSNDEVAFYDLEGTVQGLSVESGQMMFSKVEHFRSIVLALYYNVFGDGLYYKLLYQGAWGWGDRDTFHTALLAMKETFFFSEFMAWHLGWMAGDELKDTTVVQHDPIQSYLFMKKWRQWLRKKGLDSRMKMSQNNDYTKKLKEDFMKDHPDLKIPDVAFLHIHNPKINPLKNTLLKDGVYDNRILGLPDAYKDYLGETDWELRLQSIAKFITCDMLDASYWTGIKRDPTEVCKVVTEFVDKLNKDTKYPEFGEVKLLNELFLPHDGT